MEQSNCKTCESILHGPFCSKCGQKVITDRLTVRSITRNFFAQLTNIENGFWYTMVRLTKAPWKVVDDVIKGKTVKYYNPFRYVFIWATVSVLINLGLGVYDAQQAEVQEGMKDLLGVGQENATQSAVQQKFQEEVKNWLNLFIILLIPFMSRMTSWFFKKQSLNFAEHLVANTYLLGQTTLLGIPLILLMAVFPLLISFQMLFGFTITIIFYTYTFRSLFDVSTFTAFWKSTLSALLSNLAMIITIAIIGTLVVVVYALMGGSFQN